MLPPTRARRGGRGLSFSFFSCRRECLRPPEALTQRIFRILRKQKRLSQKKNKNHKVYHQASPRSLRPRPRTPRSTPTDCLKDHPAILSPHIKETQHVAFASTGGHPRAPRHCGLLQTTRACRAHTVPLRSSESEVRGRYFARLSI